MAAPEFVHLRVHSDFSMVDGLAKTKPIVAKAQELEMPALAITDQMNFCGLVRFYGAAPLTKSALRVGRLSRN